MDTLNYSLSGDEVQRIAGAPIPILAYPDLYKYKTISELLANPWRAVIILYVFESNSGGGLVGHWSCVFQNGYSLEFFCPFGYNIDQFSTDTLPAGVRRQFGEDFKYLTYLFRGAPAHLDLIQNEYIVQDPESSVCGRYVGLRLRERKRDLETFIEPFIAYGELGGDPDLLICEMTNRYL